MKEPKASTSSPQREASALFVLFVALAWVTYAFVQPSSSSPLQHPFIGIGLVFVLLPFRSDTHCRRGIVLALAMLGYWLAARLSLAWVPFLLALVLAYLLRFLYQELRMIRLPTGHVIRLSKPVAQGVILVGFLGALTLVVFVLIPGIVRQVAQLLDGARVAYTEVVAYRTKQLPLDEIEARIARGEGVYLARSVSLDESWRLTVDTPLTPELIREFRSIGLATLPVQSAPYWETWTQNSDLFIGGTLDLQGVFGEFGAKFGQALQEELQDKLSEIAGQAAVLARGLFSTSTRLIFSTLGFVATFVLSLIVLGYLLRRFDNYMNVFLVAFPPESWDRIRHVARGIDANLKSFLRGQVFIIVVIAILTTVAYGLAGIPFAMLLGIVGGLCNAIPNVGVYIAGGIALVALSVGSVTGIEPPILLFIHVHGLRGFLVRLILLPVALFIVQTIDNSFITPRVMGRAMSVDPLLIMFSVLAGGALMGFWGVLLAIPTLVIVKSAWVSMGGPNVPIANGQPGPPTERRDDEASRLDDLV